MSADLDMTRALRDLSADELRHLETGMIHNFGVTLTEIQPRTTGYKIRNSETGMWATLSGGWTVEQAWSAAELLEQ